MKALAQIAWKRTKFVMLTHAEAARVTPNHSLFYDLCIAFLLLRDLSNVQWIEIFC